MTSPTLLRQLTVTASTRRPPAFTGGKRGPAAAHLAQVNVSPLTPVSNAIMLRQQIRTPYALLETFCEEAVDIQEGDDLVIAGRDYPVRFVEKWQGFRLVVVEDLKNTRPA